MRKSYPSSLSDAAWALDGVHVMIDKTQCVIGLRILPGNLQDAAALRDMLPSVKARFPGLKRVLGDRAYRQRPLSEWAAQEFNVVVDGDSPPLPKGTIFRPMPTRWRIGQFFSWLAKWRRIAKNWCFSLAGFTKDVGWSLLGLKLRRLTS